MSEEVVIQKLFRKDDSPISLAIRYFSIISVLFNLGLAKKEVELLAFIAVKGTISYSSIREEFIQMFSSSKNSVENMKGKLYRKKLLIKIDRKYKINPSFGLDFTKDLILQINLNHLK